MQDTKIVVVVRDDLLVWQKLNVVAFLSSGLPSADPDILGEKYEDNQGNIFNALCRQPIMVMAADQDRLNRIHGKAIERNIQSSVYSQGMFATGNDADNRAEFKKFDPDDVVMAGIALYGDKKSVDKAVKGAKMHP